MRDAVVKCEDEEAVAEAREAYLEKHPDAMWVDFGDFSLFRRVATRCSRRVCTEQHSALLAGIQAWGWPHYSIFPQDGGDQGGAADLWFR